ncbi:Plant invertase/pectin methylesterase inhibitor superfamily [Thalictrum thalictroides]|uniref:Plant invertase/pectin methylesterase inhibitor superfamily n=1 Tax=Thalictrum thalictroides TaxID=46969 RepID=A0A7J6X6G1_THATH|nr:Plant invertase/pectin methylesterase inhibitor superfamily [Thalictrum thalictroides]
MALYYSKPKAHKNFLGIPWKEYFRTVFIHCTLEALVATNGWNHGPAIALPTLYYGEFENYGPGANVSGRVPWSN